MTRPSYEKKTYELVPAGNHVARLYSIIDIGTVEEEYKGEFKSVYKVRLSFELCNEKKKFKEGEEEKPLVVSGDYTYSLSEKANIRKIIDGITGGLKEDELELFNLDTLIGKACLLNVIHKTSQSGNEYAKIDTATPLPEGMEAPEQVNKDFILKVDEATDEQIEALPDFIKEKMMKSLEYSKRGGEEKAPF